MVRYLSLLTYTDQGMQAVRQTCERAKQFHAAVEAAGGRVISQYWALGECDGVIVFEVPNESSGAALLLSLAQLGNVRTRTIRLFDEAEMRSVLARM